MNNNNNGSKLEKLLRSLMIDPDKPVAFRQQLTVMFTVLLVSCLLFTVVYVFQSFRLRSAGDDQNSSSASQLSGTDETSGEKAPAPEKSADESSAVQSSAEESREKKPEQEDADITALGDMTTTLKSGDDVHSGTLILVNKDYSCRSDGENTVHMTAEKSGSYMVVDNNVCFDKDTIGHVNDFFDAFASVYGETDVIIACGYRSYFTQVRLYSEEIDNNGQNEAERWVAPPGYSEHQTGYAFDLNLQNMQSGGINYDGEGIYSWLNQNCGDYGFTLRYRKGKEDITKYSYEPWHFRYVGLPHSVYLETYDMTLEEYLDKLREHTKNNPLKISDGMGGEWCVYYVQAEEYGDTEVPVPAELDYEISGDNVNGFIVTVKIS